MSAITFGILDRKHQDCVSQHTAPTFLHRQHASRACRMAAHTSDELHPETSEACETVMQSGPACHKTICLMAPSSTPDTTDALTRVRESQICCSRRSAVPHSKASLHVTRVTLLPHSKCWPNPLAERYTAKPWVRQNMTTCCASRAQNCQPSHSEPGGGHRRNGMIRYSA